MPFVATGTQYEVGNLQLVFHEGDDIDAVVDNAIDKIDTAFDGATAYRIVDLKFRRDGQSRTLVQATGLEPFKETKLVNTLRGYLSSMVKKNYYPVIFDVRLFISYDEPKL